MATGYPTPRPGHGIVWDDVYVDDFADNIDDLNTRVGVFEALGRGLAKTTPSGNTTSATYANVPATAPVVTLTKAFASTTLVVTLITEVFNTGVAGIVTTLGVNIGGTDYDVINRVTAVSNQREEMSGTIDITGIAAGSITVTPRWKTASGTLSTSLASWCLRVEEKV